MSTGDKTNPTVGAELARILGDVSKINPSVLRSVATQLTERADVFRTLSTRHMEIHDAAKTEAGALTDGNVPPIYEDTLTALEKAGGVFKTNFDKLATQFDNDAAGLLWIVNNREQIEADTKKNLEKATA